MGSIALKPTAYRYWALRMLVYAIVLLSIAYFRAGGGAVVSDLLAKGCLWAGIPLLVLSHVKQEKKDNAYTVAFVGLLACNLLFVVLPFLGFIAEAVL